MIQLLPAITLHQGLKHCGLVMFEAHLNGLNFKVNSVESKYTSISISNSFVIVWALRKWYSDSINGRMTDNTVAKRKGTNNYLRKKLHRNQKIEQHEPHYKSEVNSVVEEGYISCSTSGSRCVTVKRHKYISSYISF